MICGVGRRGGSDPALLWLWRRLAATAPIRPLAWEPPYATGSGPKKGKKTKVPIRDRGEGNLGNCGDHCKLILAQESRQKEAGLLD